MLSDFSNKSLEIQMLQARIYIFWMVPSRVLEADHTMLNYIQYTIFIYHTSVANFIKSVPWKTKFVRVSGFFTWLSLPARWAGDTWKAHSTPSIFPSLFSLVSLLAVQLINSNNCGSFQNQMRLYFELTGKFRGKSTYRHSSEWSQVCRGLPAQSTVHEKFIWLTLGLIKALQTNQHVTCQHWAYWMHCQ